MQFRSIQNRILVMAGIAMTAALVILILLNQYSGQQTQQLTISSSREALQQEAWQKVSANARAEAATITQLLQKALAYDQQLAGVVQLAISQELPLTRPHVVALMKKTLTTDPQIYGVLAGFEPNALDGQDSNYLDQKPLGSDSSGRFVPYYYRDGGSIGTDLLYSITKTDTDSFGNPANDYYSCPQQHKTACLIDPYVFDVNASK